MNFFSAVCKPFKWHMVCVASVFFLFTNIQIFNNALSLSLSLSLFFWGGGSAIITYLILVMTLTEQHQV